MITITPEEGERYQGVVGLEGDTLAACLEDYFLRSEQLRRACLSVPAMSTVNRRQVECCFR